MSASDWIGIGVIVLVIVGGLILLNHITKPYDVKDEEEFERRRKQSAGMMVAGLKGLQQMLDPSAKKAAEVQEDLRRGVYDDEEEADDPPEAGAEADERVRKRL
ncbi:MAG TPA: hypothetical protein VFU37_13105 [Pyrinomonadaceae bacterium]|nr:hypothetical protein [Pyrinomonadaceae bacterium]